MHPREVHLINKANNTSFTSRVGVHLHVDLVSLNDVVDAPFLHFHPFVSLPTCINFVW